MRHLAKWLAYNNKKHQGQKKPAKKTGSIYQIGGSQRKLTAKLPRILDRIINLYSNDILGKKSYKIWRGPWLRINVDFLILMVGLCH